MRILKLCNLLFNLHVLAYVLSRFWFLGGAEGTTGGSRTSRASVAAKKAA